MKVAAALALVALAAVAAAAAANGGARAACPKPVAGKVDRGHAYQLDVYDLYGSVADTRGNRFDVPGVNENTTLSNQPTPPLDQQLLIDEGASNSYIVTLKDTQSFPVRLTLARTRAQGANAEYLADDIASWFVPYSLHGAKLTLAFATGQPVAGDRLCVDGHPLPPTSTVSGPKAKDQDPPRIRGTVTTAGAGKARITLSARDAGSGVAGIWTIVNNRKSRRLSRYTAPFVVPRGPEVIAFAVDRAGNLTTPAFATR